MIYVDRACDVRRIRNLHKKLLRMLRQSNRCMEKTTNAKKRITTKNPRQCCSSSSMKYYTFYSSARHPSFAHDTEKQTMLRDTWDREEGAGWKYFDPIAKTSWHCPACTRAFCCRGIPFAVQFHRAQRVREIIAIALDLNHTNTHDARLTCLDIARQRTEYHVLYTYAYACGLSDIRPCPLCHLIRVFI